VSYLPDGMPRPVPDALTAPFWAAAREERLLAQRCGACGTWQWGPEWCCHACRTFDPGWTEVPAPGGVYRGRIYSWERNHHPVHPALRGRAPYIVVLVELPDAGNIRMVGNLLGNPMQEVRIGAEVKAAFEHHNRADPPYTLVQWQCI